MTTVSAEVAETPFRPPARGTMPSAAAGHLAMSGSSPAAALAQSVQVAVDVLRVDSVGLMLLDEHGALQAVGFTDDEAAVLQAMQARLSQSPGRETIDTATTVAVADLALVPAYAALWAGVSASGLRAVLSCPIWAGGAVVGNLNAARRRPHTWTADEIRETEAYAKVVGLLLDLATPSGGGEDNMRTDEHNHMGDESPTENAETSGGGSERASRPRGAHEQPSPSR